MAVKGWICFDKLFQRDKKKVGLEIYKSRRNRRNKTVKYEYPPLSLFSISQIKKNSKILFLESLS